MLVAWMLCRGGRPCWNCPAPPQGFPYGENLASGAERWLDDMQPPAPAAAFSSVANPPAAPLSCGRWCELDISSAARAASSSGDISSTTASILSKIALSCAFETCKCTARVSSMPQVASVYSKNGCCRGDYPRPRVRFILTRPISGNPRLASPMPFSAKCRGIGSRKGAHAEIQRRPTFIQECSRKFPQNSP